MTKPCKNCGIDFVKVNNSSKYCATCKPIVHAKQLVASNNKMKTFCDCGQPAVKRDSTGSFCLECEKAVLLMQEMLGDLIRSQRTSERLSEYDERLGYEVGANGGWM